MDYQKQGKKAKKMKSTGDDREEEEDRISKLSDDLIHLIMSFLDDSRSAVRTCTLSKRWRFVWKTLPYLKFHGCYHKTKLRYSKFIHHVFNKRNHQCQLQKLDITAGLTLAVMKRYFKYAISHNVETMYLDLDRYYVLSLFNSCTLKELRLTMPFEYSDVMELDCWTLPNLTTLYLKLSQRISKHSVKFRQDIGFVGRFPQSCLICLSALTTLGLDNCKLPEFFSLPCLTTLYLVNCTLPENVWDLPALSTLQLNYVQFPKNMSEYFLALSNLRNLAIAFPTFFTTCVISGYQLVNLKIKVLRGSVNGSEGKIVVSAPKLCNFIAIGFFPITFEGCEPETVQIQYFRTALYCVDNQKFLEDSWNLFKMMFPQLGSTKNLTLDLKTLQELSKISDHLVHLESPFYKLKHLKLPLGCKASSISSILRRYLLGASPKATIVEKD